MNHSQAAIWMSKREAVAAAGCDAGDAAARAMSVTRTAVISTTNMTGLRTSRRGSSLRTACGSAARSERRVEDARGGVGGSASGFWPPQLDEALEAARAAGGVEGHGTQTDLPACWRQLLDDRAERERGEEVEGADDDHDADQQDRRRCGPVVGNVPGEAATRRLAAIDPAIARIGMIIANRPTSIAMAPVTL